MEKQYHKFRNYQIYACMGTEEELQRLQAAQIISNLMCYGPCPEPDDVIEQRLTISATGRVKHCYAKEIEDYYRVGQNVVYYCQKGRRTYEQWENAKNLMKRIIPEAYLVGVTFHRGTQRTIRMSMEREKKKALPPICKRFGRDCVFLFAKYVPDGYNRFIIY